MAKTKTTEAMKLSEQIRQYVGKTGHIELEGMTFEVAIKSHENKYGRDLLTIAPKKGEGQTRVWASRLTLA